MAIKDIASAESKAKAAGGKALQKEIEKEAKDNLKAQNKLAAATTKTINKAFGIKEVEKNLGINQQVENAKTAIANNKAEAAAKATKDKATEQ